VRFSRPRPLDLRLRLPGGARLLAVAAAGALLLAACDGGDEDTTQSAAGPPDLAQVPTAEPLPERPDPVIVTGRADGGTRAPVTYEVQPGDTPSGIADRFDLTVEDLLAANGLGPDDAILVGQLLQIPSGDTGGGSGDGADGGAGESDGGDGGGTPAPGGSSTYVVEPGDTPLGIAFAFDVTLEQLAAANGMSTDDLLGIQPGDELVIPSP